LTFLFWIFLYEYENLYFYSKNYALKFWIIIWFEPEISIPNYHFGFSKLILLVWKLLNESQNGHFNVEYSYLNLDIII